MFAKVYRGLLARERHVAVKIIHDLEASFQEDGKPLEALLMQAADHPNVLRLLDYKLTENLAKQKRLWLILDYCDGGSLAVRRSEQNTHQLS